MEYRQRFSSEVASVENNKKSRFSIEAALNVMSVGLEGLEPPTNGL